MDIKSIKNLLNLEKDKVNEEISHLDYLTKKNNCLDDINKKFMLNLSANQSLVDGLICKLEAFSFFMQNKNLETEFKQFTKDAGIDKKLNDLSNEAYKDLMLVEEEFLKKDEDIPKEFILTSCKIIKLIQK